MKHCSPAKPSANPMKPPAQPTRVERHPHRRSADNSEPGVSRLRPAGIRGFFLRLAAWYFGLLLLWIPFGAFYRDALIRSGNVVLEILRPRHEITVVRYERWREIGASERLDLAVLVRAAGPGDARGQKHYVLAKAVATFYQPFMALVFLLALHMASPFTARQRLRRGGSAAIWLHLWMVGCVLVDAYHALPGSAAPVAGTLDWSRTLIAMLHFSITDWPAGVLVVPLLLWVLHGLTWRESRDPRIPT